MDVCVNMVYVCVLGRRAIGNALVTVTRVETDGHRLCCPRRSLPTPPPPPPLPSPPPPSPPPTIATTPFSMPASHIPASPFPFVLPLFLPMPIRARALTYAPRP